MIDYIITGLPHAENFESIVSDTTLRISKNTDIDHLANSIITTIEVKTKSKVISKEVIDKSNYSKEVFCSIINNADWGSFYNQDCAEGMYAVFCDIIERALH